jgi:hypothetical protein
VEGVAFHAVSVGGEPTFEVGFVAAEFGAEAGADSAEVEVFETRAFEVGEEPTDALGERCAGAEVDRSLSAAVAVGDSVVGAEGSAVIMATVGDEDARGGDDCAAGKDSGTDALESVLGLLFVAFCRLDG